MYSMLIDAKLTVLNASTQNSAVIIDDILEQMMAV